MTNAPDATPESYYAKHRKIYPREVHGGFARLRTLAVFALLGLYYLLPWVNWNGRQAILFDLPARQFHLFGLVMWPQDFIFLTALLVIAGLVLFFSTALAGRLWCGYACPQTVWTEVFLWIERAIEGDRSRRLKLDRAPWSLGKLARKGGKQLVWLAFALWTGITFVGFFTPIRQLLPAAFHFDLGPWETFWSLFYGFATYGNAGYLREQVCKYMCPYARFQSAMFDKDTLIITYDAKRGEPRGSRPRGTDARTRGQGDCIDCQACVQVCPTGIDIRQGLQYECIACAACIDACDEVMDRIESPRGLIRYTTQHALDGKTTHLLRPRVIVYASILGAVLVAFVVALGLRKPLAMDVLRDRATLYREVIDGSGRQWFENAYELRVMNKDGIAHRYVLSAEAGGHGHHDLRDLVVDTTGARLAAGPGEVASIPVRVRIPGGSAHGSRPLKFILREADGKRRAVVEKSRFIAP
jgi:cytochrome c oxidase accessory protein FixG